MKNIGLHPEDVYFVNLEKVKIRYSNPLMKRGGETVRISEISELAKKDIEQALNFSTRKYAYLDFKFS